jgi:hypothetical protein
MLHAAGMDTTRRTLVLVTALVLAPVAARAQEPEPPGECTTTTTVHCTGAAAKYAVPGAVAPAPAAPVAAPTVAAPPPPAYYPPPMVVNLKLGDGWQLLQHSDGSWWRERTVSTPSTSMVTTGAIVFGASWLASGIASMTTDHTMGPVGWLPVLGAWFNAASMDSSCYDCNDHSDRKMATALWALDGIAQAAGFVALLVGLSAGPKKVERQPVTFVPTFGGVGAAGQF